MKHYKHSTFILVISIFFFFSCESADFNATDNGNVTLSFVSLGQVSISATTFHALLFRSLMPTATRCSRRFAHRNSLTMTLAPSIASWLQVHTR